MSPWSPHRAGSRVVRAAVAGVLGVVLTLTGCSSDEEPAASSSPSSARSSAPSTAPPPATSPAAPAADAVQYVALGDSYAAAPGVPETDPADGCFRSDSNYAHVLAEIADLALVDATCSGATSDEIIAEQVPLVSAETDVVTIGTGGNDLDLFVRVLTSCLSFPGVEPDPERPTCADVVRDEIEPDAAEIQAKMGAVLDAVLEAAPDAQVFVVGYPRLLPEQGSCPDVVPIAVEDYPFVGGLTRSLSESLRAEAEERGLAFVDVFAASRGHDLCSEEPWVNGAQVARDGTAPFHPFAIEQAAVAALVGEML